MISSVEGGLERFNENYEGLTGFRKYSEDWVCFKEDWEGLMKIF